MPLTDLIRELLAAARLLRLIRDDAIFNAPREHFVQLQYWLRGDVKPEQYTWQEWAMLDRHPPKLAQLMECPWCLGVWCGFAVLVLRRTSVGRGLRDALAMSYAASLAEIHIVKPPHPES